LCGCDPRLVVADSPTELVDRLDVLSGAADRRLVELTAACLAPSPEERPDTKEVHDALAVARTGRAKRPVATRTPRLEAGIRAGVGGLRLDAPRDPSSGLWLSQTERTERGNGSDHVFSLRRDAHHGVAGVVYALASLVRLGYVEREVVSTDILAAADWLLDDTVMDTDERLPGLFFGDAGVAIALLEAKRVGVDLDIDRVQSVLSASLAAPLDWLDMTHGAAGQSLAVLLCEPEAPDAGVALGRICDRLLGAQEPDGSWRVPPGVDGLSGQTLTGFAHGCAGIVYALAACASCTGSRVIEDSCRRGADWLLDAALETRPATFEWTYSDTVADRWRWWCHGGPGIALGFMRVFALTGEGRYADAASRALNIHQMGVRSTNLSLCHGLAGLGEIYLEAAHILDDRRWRAAAEAIAATALALGRTTPSGHLTWLVEDPAISTADLMIGTAGILHFLSRLDSCDSSVGFPLLLPAATAVRGGA
jgi:hypothetical protein